MFPLACASLMAEFRQEIRPSTAAYARQAVATRSRHLKLFSCLIRLLCYLATVVVSYPRRLAAQAFSSKVFHYVINSICSGPSYTAYLSKRPKFRS
jgi:hypothetical protein